MKRYNRELEELYSEPNTLNVIKSRRLMWAGHVVRMDEDELPKKILRTNPRGQRGRGRPKARWIDGVEEDARKLSCRNWWSDVQDRGRWRHLLEEAKVPTQGCRADDDDDDDDDVGDKGKCKNKVFFWCLIKHQAMKSYGSAEAQLHAFTSAVGQWSG